MESLSLDFTLHQPIMPSPHPCSPKRCSAIDMSNLYLFTRAALHFRTLILKSWLFKLLLNVPENSYLVCPHNTAGQLRFTVPNAPEFSDNRDWGLLFWTDISTVPGCRCAVCESHSLQICVELTKIAGYIPSAELIFVYFCLYVLQKVLFFLFHLGFFYNRWPGAPGCSSGSSQGWKPSSSSSCCQINSPQLPSGLPSSCCPRTPLSEDGLLLEIP